MAALSFGPTCTLQLEIASISVVDRACHLGRTFSFFIARY